jgi:hypothetical protein
MALTEIPRYKGRFISPNGEPPGRKPPDIRSMARRYSRSAIKTLATISQDENQPAAARVSAASILLDRGWGKVPQPVAGEDGEGGIEVIIRHLVEDHVREPLTIEGNKVASSDEDGE